MYHFQCSEQEAKQIMEESEKIDPEYKAKKHEYYSS